LNFKKRLLGIVTVGGLPSWALPGILDEFRDRRAGAGVAYLLPLIRNDLLAHSASELRAPVASQMLDERQSLKPS
jgi:hypothetical protein